MARIDEEAEDLITLGKLLRKKRNETVRELVEEIIAGRHTITEKVPHFQRIPRIRKIEPPPPSLPFSIPG